MDAIMGATTGIYSSLLDGLDIVAITHDSGSQSYPAGAKYGLVTDINAGALLFPMCFKVGITSQFRLHCLAAGTSQLTVDSWGFNTTASKYDTGNDAMSIIWFG